MGGQRRPVEVEADLLLEGVGLADEDVGAARGLGEDVGPLGITGIDQCAAAGLQAQRERGRAARMHHQVRDHAHAGDLGRLSRLPLDEGGHESPLDPRGAGEQRLQRGGHPGLDPGRPGHHERAGAAPELAVEQDERHAAEMIAVEM
jgi:hypothetical protein